MKKHRILIAEDEDWIAQDLRETLEENNFEVIDVVDSYEAALLTLRNTTPDLVILDIRLKGIGTGVDIAKEINERWAIPFLFLSSNIDPKTMKDILDEVPASILTKPCKPFDLIAGVRLALSKGEVEITNSQSNVIENDFFVKSEHSYRKIEIPKLLYIKGEGSYTKVQMENERLVLRATLKDFDFLENHSNILRVHRSYLVNSAHIDKIHSKHLDIKEFEIPITKEGREQLLSRINRVR